MRRLLGPDPLGLRLRLLAVEVVASAGIAGVLWVAGHLIETQGHTTPRMT